ncbi:MAG: DUF454 family protein [Wenzhouxiangellaceae bacterium]|nr:DUF454 family protein [Wenzhouxiangellaceae bacterium]
MSRGTPLRVAGVRAAAASLVAVGLVGVVLPLLPTTPFLLLALWLADRGDPAFSRRLRRHPRLARIAEDWRRHRHIPVAARVLAIALMASSWTVLLLVGAGPLPLASIGALFLILAGWLVTRPASAP